MILEWPGRFALFLFSCFQEYISFDCFFQGKFIKLLMSKDPKDRPCAEEVQKTKEFKAVSEVFGGSSSKNSRTWSRTLTYITSIVSHESIVM